jgi:hypothetical protein
MTNQSYAQSDDPRSLLTTTRDLTHRVRLTQRGGWFPLLVFAAITFAAIPFNRYGPHRIQCSPTHGGGNTCIAYPALTLWYWPVALVAAYLAISWFYLRRSHNRGVGTRVQPYVAVGVVLTVLVSVWAFWANTHPAVLVDTLHLPSSQLTRFLYRIASPAGAIGLALLLLAWIERSRQLLTVTIAYLVVAVATVGIDWFAHPTPWAFLPHLLIDGVVLLIGGILLAVAQQAQGPSSA